MQSVVVSTKFQIVIPRIIRESLGIQAGQKIQFIAYNQRIEIIPLKDVKAMRGFVKGIDTNVDRDEDRV